MQKIYYVNKLQIYICNLKFNFFSILLWCLQWISQQPRTAAYSALGLWQDGWKEQATRTLTVTSWLSRRNRLTAKDEVGNRPSDSCCTCRKEINKYWSVIWKQNLYMLQVLDYWYCSRFIFQLMVILIQGFHEFHICILLENWGGTHVICLTHVKGLFILALTAKSPFW